MQTAKKFTATEWDLVSDLYDRASRAEGEEREKILAQAPSKVAAEVRRLLANDVSTKDFVKRLPNVDPDKPLELQPGEMIGDYIILGLIGEGGLAKVYQAKQVSLARIVALKVALNRNDEAKTMAQMEHPNIVTVFSEQVIEDRGLRVIAMQYVPGTTLDKVLKNIRRKTGPSLPELDAFVGLDSLQAVLRIGEQMARALAHAHDRGVLHLDVKPSNILFSPDGVPMLTDFNVSLNSSDGEASKGPLGGTFEYMPEEQTRALRSGETIAMDGRADVYSMAKVLIELLDALGDTKKDPAHDEARYFLSKCMRPNRDERVGSAKEMADGLQTCQELRHVERFLETKSRFINITLKHPMEFLQLLGAVPQILATYVSITYNIHLIVSELTPLQQTVFYRLVWTYTPAMYVVGFIMSTVIMAPLLRYYKDPEHFRDLSSRAYLRSRVASLPFYMLTISLIGWIPGSFLFPILLHVLAGAMSPPTYMQFLFSFWFACAIALSFTFLFTQFIAIRVFYPRFISAGEPLRLSARKELVGSLRWLRRLRFFPQFVPLAGAILILLHQRMDANPLVITLILLSILGALLVHRLTGYLLKTLLAFMGETQDLVD